MADERHEWTDGGRNLLAIEEGFRVRGMTGEPGKSDWLPIEPQWVVKEIARELLRLAARERELLALTGKQTHGISRVINLIVAQYSGATLRERIRTMLRCGINNMAVADALVALSELAADPDAQKAAGEIACGRRFGPHRCTLPRGHRDYCQEELEGNVPTVDDEAELLRADNEALCREIADCRALLSPYAAEESLAGAIRNLQQAHVSERGNAEKLETDNEAIRARAAELEEWRVAAERAYSAELKLRQQSDTGITRERHDYAGKVLGNLLSRWPALPTEHSAGELQALRGKIEELENRTAVRDYSILAQARVQGDIRLRTERDRFRAQCAAQRSALLVFFRWAEEGFPSEPERKEWYLEAKDLLAHPAGSLAVEWYRTEMAEASRALRADNEALRAKLEEARATIDRLEDGRREWLRAHQVYFRAGLLACREYMASFVAPQSPSVAASIRANWWPALGPDFGPPRKIDFGELTEGEYGKPEFRWKNASEISPTLEALPIALAFLGSTSPSPAEPQEEGLADLIDRTVELEQEIPLSHDEERRVEKTLERLRAEPREVGEKSIADARSAEECAHREGVREIMREVRRREPEAGEGGER